MKIKKYTVMLSLLAGIIIIASAGTSSASPAISIDPIVTSANQGDGFTIDITVDPAGSEIAGVELKLAFDPAVVRLDTIDIGSFLGANPIEWLNSVDNSAGNVQLSYTIKQGTPAVTGQGTFATLNFHIIENAQAGTSDLDMAFVKLVDDSATKIPDVTANGGTIEITEDGISPVSSGTGDQSSSQTQETNGDDGDVGHQDVNAEKTDNQPAKTEVLETVTADLPEQTADTETGAESTPAASGFQGILVLFAALYVRRLGLL